jgi:hypothetical protein
MATKKRTADPKWVEQVQERSRQNWNRLVERGIVEPTEEELQCLEELGRTAQEKADRRWAK